MNENELKQLYQRSSKFMAAAIEAFKAGGGTPGEKYYFKCPLCGGDAVITAVKYNGHKLAKCRQCKAMVRQ